MDSTKTTQHEQGQNISRTWVWRTAGVSSRNEDSGGQFWKRLRSTKNCNARRRRRL